MMAKTLPNRHNDKGYVKDSEDYAKRQIQNLKVGDIEKALSRAYLDGAHSHTNKTEFMQLMAKARL